MADKKSNLPLAGRRIVITRPREQATAWRSRLESLGAGSAALVLSDLPSGETAAKFDRAPDFARFWPAVWDALSPTGCAVLMASSLRFAAAVIASQPKAYR